ncbi:transposase DDE domain protein [Halolamina pelagica]|uniref:Transposase DDE domain protein n=1 Tax=Halolamina pelagica TaxID=699431 RepID=A0A0P7GDR6_9EURY|nr:transposase DDE domain protein [Halolamina pelagica]
MLQLHDPSGHAAIDLTFFDRENASKHYCRRTNYRVQTLKATALVDIESQASLDVHCMTEKMHDTQLGWQVACHNAADLTSLAADKGLYWMQLREKLRKEDVKPLIKRRIFYPSTTCITRGSMGLATGKDRCVRPSSRRSSARTATPCLRENAVPRIS